MIVKYCHRLPKMMALRNAILLTLTWLGPPLPPLLASVSNPGTPPPPFVLTLYVYLPIAEILCRTDGYYNELKKASL